MAVSSSGATDVDDQQLLRLGQQLIELRAGQDRRL